MTKNVESPSTLDSMADVPIVEPPKASILGKRPREVADSSEATEEQAETTRLSKKQKIKKLKMFNTRVKKSKADPEINVEAPLQEDKVLTAGANVNININVVTEELMADSGSSSKEDSESEAENSEAERNATSKNTLKNMLVALQAKDLKAFKAGDVGSLLYCEHLRLAKEVCKRGIDDEFFDALLKKIIKHERYYMLKHVTIETAIHGTVQMMKKILDDDSEDDFDDLLKFEDHPEENIKRDRGLVLVDRLDSCICTYAAETGNLPMIGYLHFRAGARWGECVTMAAMLGHIKLLEWLKKVCDEWCPRKVLEGAIQGDRLEVLEWFKSQGGDLSQCDWIEETCWHGSFEALRWAASNGVPINWPKAKPNRTGSNPELPQWVKDKKVEQVELWENMERAIKAKQQDALETGFSKLEHPNPVDDLLSVAIVHDNSKAFEVALNRLAELTTHTGDEDDWMEDMSIQRHSDDIIKYNRLDMFKHLITKYVRSEMIYFFMGVAEHCLRFGRKEMFEWLVSNDYAWNRVFCRSLAKKHNNKAILEFIDNQMPPAN